MNGLIAEKTELKANAVKKVLECLGEVIVSELATKQSVRLGKLGTFKLVDKIPNGKTEAVKRLVFRATQSTKTSLFEDAK